jgi:fermentation-respiration switch protein FrsA (DUF1100 family)
MPLSNVSRRKVPRWVGWPLLGLWVFFVLSYLARQSTFHPMPYPEGLWDLRESLGAQDVWLQTSDEVQIHGWHVRVAGESEWVTLYLHGNAGNITHRADHLVAIREAGSEVFIIDYRGYGKSDGSPTEAGMYRDADAAYQYLLDQGYEANRIVVHGESLGTAAAVDLASRKSCAGVVLEAPFPSARAVARTVLPVIGPLLVSGLETGRKIKQVKAPVLIIHGDRDEVIAYDLGREVFEAANDPKEFWTLEGSGHNNIVQVGGRRYVEKLRAFYAGLRAAGAGDG